MNRTMALSGRLRRVGFWEGVFGVLVLTFGIVTILRFTQGLGAVTNLSDEFPWGLWIGLDVLCGVGLAAGAFTLTAVVHLFNLHRWEPIVRPTVLTGFLGYLLVIVGLMFDLGQPWRIWHAMIFWNPHSVMFEVAWCVMLYTTVLALEFSPIVFEKLRLEGPRRLIRALTTPLVIAGAMDQGTPPEMARVIAQGIPGARLVVLPEASHLSVLEQPLAFRSAVDDWLQQALPA